MYVGQSPSSHAKQRYAWLLVCPALQVCTLVVRLLQCQQYVRACCLPLISSSLLAHWCGKTTSYSGKLTREHGETYLL